ncbi:MAG: TetR/AcrR family transcriptional regulator [Clostridiales bacterium]|nr:TetR/AcrR family transcriptional regulator [Clostridiales bacterium]
MSTKKRITEEALTLFAQKGYKGTSVKQIAEAVGIKDASLYKHFRSKQEIFDSIVALINEHISNLSDTLGIPQKENQNVEASIFYKKLDLDELKDISGKVFIFYLTDPYISKFWRIAHMEQYQNDQIYGMFRQIFMDDAITYQTDLFAEMMKAGILREGNARAVAISFYAPIFLLLTKYADHSDKKDDALEILDSQIEEFVRVYRKADHE